MNINSYLKKQSARIHKTLDAYLPKVTGHPVKLHQAMRYAVFSGGKRIRPLFALAACQAVGGDEKKVLPAAVALEFIHNYSLIHDDLPCMDDDDLRRGQPSCHKKFGENTAILAGDALLTLAFKTLTASNGSRSSTAAARTLQAAHWVAEAIGSRGMVGGQALDMEYKGKEPNLAIIDFINTHKSGALIAVAVRVGGYLGGGTPRQVEALYRYGKSAGLLFQIVDDIMDREGYAKVMGVPEARREAQTLHEKAQKQLEPFGRKAAFLRHLADFVLTRKT